MIDGWMAAMIRASWQGAIAVGLVWIVCKCLPRLPSNIRCWLWRLALLKTVLAALPLGSLDVPVLPRAWVAEASVLPDRVPAISITNFGILTTETRANISVGPNGGETTLYGSLPTARPASPRTTILFFVWLTVLAAFAGTIVVRVFAARTWRREWRLVKDHDILALSERLSERLGLFQPPVLFEAESCRSPVVFGAVRTSIVLPASLVATCSASQLEMILAHEMSHIRRYDLVGNWFSTLVSALFFFHPLVWFAVRESRLSQEVACDELAVRRPGVSIAEYGRLLIELATGRPVTAMPLVTVGVVESFQTFLKRRLCAMKSIGTRSRKTLVLSWAIGLAAVLGLLPWRLAAAPNPEAKLPKAEDVKVEASSSGYKLAIDRVRYVPGHMIAPGRSGLPFIPPGEMKMEGNMVDETSPDGRTRMQGGAMGGGMGGGSGGAFRVPNLVLDVLVKGRKLPKNHVLLCTTEGKVHAIDELNHGADSPSDPSWIKTELAGVDYLRGSGRTAIHLFLPPFGEGTHYLKTVEGKMAVCEAAISEATFQKKELERKAVKRVNGKTIRIDKVEEVGGGIEVTVAVSAPQNRDDEEIDPMRNPMAAMQKMMMNSASGQVSLTMMDNEGKTHTAQSKNGQTQGGMGGGNFVAGGVGGGGTTRSWRRSGPHGMSGGSSTSSRPDTSKPHVYRFDILPAGVEMKSITCTVTDIVGKPKLVPFKFNDVPLPNMPQ